LNAEARAADGVINTASADHAAAAQALRVAPRWRLTIALGFTSWQVCREQ
jgi:hypothetical protein